eukprot:gnl/MRDRNA2_/MRDRNA2_84056_c0_seq1.p1 gnl/MRDRNA2_/MRDRNA2_84056_c0~~gnl/MRDRNA2_/MRDRNA2_84056_c0_seq1.p1  ORF type:complete len:134 (+),score=15.33 gnl/MRDRNA2_/MRDRNA2_84056_c0_seq1:177-578(+)
MFQYQLDTFNGGIILLSAADLHEGDKGKVKQKTHLQKLAAPQLGHRLQGDRQPDGQRQDGPRLGTRRPAGRRQLGNPQQEGLYGTPSCMGVAPGTGKENLFLGQAKSIAGSLLHNVQSLSPTCTDNVVRSSPM